MMCEAGEVCDKDIILEIGPGKGALTKKLLEKAGRVIAVEKDIELFEFLKERFAEEIKNGKLILLNEDILQFEFPLPLPRGGLGRGELIKNFPYKLIANIPYNITGAILKKFLSSLEQPERMILLVQKEVAERIVARDNKESILSLSVKVYGIPKYIMKVSKRFFSPSPKVDSAIIAIKDISHKNFNTKNDENIFFELIKTGFAHKRKILRKNLESLKIERTKEVEPSSSAGMLPKIDEIFGKLKIDPKSRAEDINFKNWLLISQNLSTKI